MLIVKNSNIQGLGVFTKKPIRSGEKLFDYIGEEMSLKTFKERYGEYKHNSINTYRMKRINKILVAKEEPYKSKNIVNYINESNNPNCVLKKKALYALKDIEPDEELTLKYPNDYNRDYLLHSD
jgi:SET domain-containing protein